MNKTAKIILFIAIIAISLILIPSISKATDATAANAEELINAINSAKTGDTITLTDNITLEKTISISGKDITINGDSYKITGTGDKQIDPGPGDKSLFTVLANAKVNFTNITLANSPKYGVQSYDGGYVILNNVKIENCSYGGVLVNAGTVEIIDLSLEANGKNNDNGIEISKGKSVTSANVPSILMNGTISATNQENVIYLASDENDNTTEIVIENTDNTTNKLLLDGNKIVVTDSDNNVIYESNEKDGVAMEGDKLPTTYTVTLNIEGLKETVEFTVKEGTVLTSDDVEAKIDFNKLGLADRTITGYYTDKEYTAEFDFDKAINADTEIFVKLSEEAEEPTEEPTNEVENTVVSGDTEEKKKKKTGDNLFVYVATALVAVVALGAIIKIRNNK